MDLGEGGVDDVGTLQELDAEASRHRSGLFQKNGIPMLFYVAPCEKRKQIEDLILATGGEVLTTRSRNAITLVDEENSDIPSRVHYDCFSLDFVTDTILRDELADLEKYHIVPHKRTNRKESFMPRHRCTYTDADDLRITLFIRSKQGVTPSTSRAWKSADTEQLLKRHPWQSMRTRFLRVILPKLNTLAHEKREQESQAEGGHANSLSGGLWTWDNLTEEEIASLFPHAKDTEALLAAAEDPPDPLLEPRTSHSPFVVTETMNSPQDIVHSVLNFLITASGQSQSVVIHALIVNSGRVGEALHYLQDPRQFCSRRNKEDQVWTLAEDRILLEKDPDLMQQLKAERGEAAVRDRLTFLES